MEGFMDIHSHILPNVDDGSKNMEQTIEMLKVAYEQGIRSIIATPHFEIGKKNKKPEILQETLEQVKYQIKKLKMNLEIQLGNELYYSDGIIDALKSGEAFTMANSRYVLVEFTPQTKFDEINLAFKKLILGGYIPIIAHIERYECLVKDMNLIDELIESGVYVQVNISSFLGGIVDKRSKFCRKLLKNGNLHFLGTDAHSDVHRAPMIQEAIQVISKKFGVDVIETLLKNNPSHIIKNKYI